MPPIRAALPSLRRNTALAMELVKLCEASKLGRDSDGRRRRDGVVHLGIGIVLGLSAVARRSSARVTLGNSIGLVGLVWVGPRWAGPNGLQLVVLLQARCARCERLPGIMLSGSAR
jgi:hypothetical protein